MPLVVAGVNDADAAEHEGIVANPNCSTMQLMPLFAALRDSGRHRARHRRHVPVGERHGQQGRRRARGRRSRPTPRAAASRRASTRIRSRSTRCRTSTSSATNGYTKEEWKVVAESRKILHLPDLPISCTAVRMPVFTVALGGRPRRARARRMTPDEARELFAGMPGVIVRDDPAHAEYPLRHRGRRDATRSTSGRIRQDVSLPDERGPRVLGRLGQPPQGRGHERRADRRAPRARTTGWRRRRAAPSGSRDPGRTTGRRWRPSRAKSASVIAAASRRGGRKRSPARATRTPRSSSSARGPARTRTSRAGRSSAPRASLLDELSGSSAGRARRSSSPTS